MRECIIHGDRISDWDALYDQFTKDLNLPQWFGRNLDALYDCLTEQTNCHITIYRWKKLADSLGGKADVLRQVLTDAGLESEHLTVSIMDEEPDEI